MKKTENSAFTLIELLIVIAIIGILAGLLFPAIKGGMESAQALRVGNNGKGVVTSIIAANTEREAINMGSIWPTTTSTFKDGVNVVDYSVGQSETYFSDLIKSKSIENINYSTFAGGGVPSTSDETQFLTGTFNVWNYFGALNESTPDDTPFMFSRNFNIATTDIQSYKPDGAYDNENTFGEKLDANIKPFGDSTVVVVTRGAALKQLKKKYMKAPFEFFGSPSYGDTSVEGATVNAKATIVTSKGAVSE